MNCNHCSNPLTPNLEAPDIVNGRALSVLVFHHREPVVCANCGATFIPAISTKSKIEAEFLEVEPEKKIVSPGLVLLRDGGH